MKPYMIEFIAISAIVGLVIVLLAYALSWYSKLEEEHKREKLYLDGEIRYSETKVARQKLWVKL